MILNSVCIDQHGCSFQGHLEPPVTYGKTIRVYFVKAIPSYQFEEEAGRKQKCAWESLRNEQNVDNIGCLKDRMTKLF